MRVLYAFWRLFYGLIFYPLLVGLFLWLYFTDKHWIFGLAIIVAILVFDPTWRIIARRAVQMIRNSSNND